MKKSILLIMVMVLLVLTGCQTAEITKLKAHNLEIDRFLSLIGTGEQPAGTTLSPEVDWILLGDFRLQRG